MNRLLFFISLLTLFLGCSPKKKALSVFFAGDLMLDRGVRVVISKNGPESLFKRIVPILNSSDYTFANLECPITAESTPITKKYVFKAEPQWLESLHNAGITHLCLANNHSIDHGRRGLVETAYNLVTHDIVAVGYGQTHKKACEPSIIKKQGISIALFSSVLLPLENWMYLPDKPGICQSTVEQLALNISLFKIKNPNVFIVVSLHWGVEFQLFPTSTQRKQARDIVAAGADMIIGHHPHVVQTISFINDKPVFYSIGNFIFDQKAPNSSKGILVELKCGINSSLETIVYPYKIDSCVPRPMTLKERSEYKAGLMRLCEGVILKDRTAGWNLQQP